MLVKIFIVGLVLVTVAAIWAISKEKSEDTPVAPTVEPIKEEPVEVGYETSTPVVEEKSKKARKPRAKKNA